MLQVRERLRVSLERNAQLEEELSQANQDVSSHMQIWQYSILIFIP